LIRELLDPEIQKFIRENESIDPFKLSIKNKNLNGIPFKYIAEQIISRKIAKSKLPSWHSTDGMVYPPKLSLEQCSSETTANYKAGLVSGLSFIDLTGGMGVDTLALSKSFERGIYVERNADLTDITQHNLSTLGVSNLNFVNDQAQSFINTLNETVDCIYIDPARRGEKGEKVFLFSDCEPNIIELLPILLEKSNLVMIKSSPMLDIGLSIKSLPGVYETHVISVDNECKEVLYLIRNSSAKEVKIVTINFRSRNVEQFDFYKREELEAKVSFSHPQQYLYEPNASIMKAGAFKFVCEHFGINKIHQHTHLYTSENLCENFPGRVFEIQTALPFNKKTIKKFIPEGKANITTRNFKDDVNQIRKKTGLKDGGSKYVFACTDIDNKPVMIITKKVNENALD
jgi:16S rRNA G966 N2-methylase RsmD